MFMISEERTPSQISTNSWRTHQQGSIPPPYQAGGEVQIRLGTGKQPLRGKKCRLTAAAPPSGPIPGEGEREWPEDGFCPASASCLKKCCSSENRNRIQTLCSSESMCTLPGSSENVKSLVSIIRESKLVEADLTDLKYSTYYSPFHLLFSHLT